MSDCAKKYLFNVSDDLNIYKKGLEARRGFEPLDKGFAGPYQAAVTRLSQVGLPVKANFLGQVWAKLRIQVRMQGANARIGDIRNALPNMRSSSNPNS